MVPLWEECELSSSVKYFNGYWSVQVCFCFVELILVNCILNDPIYLNVVIKMIIIFSLILEVKTMVFVILTLFASYLFCLLSLDQFSRCLSNLLVLLFFSGLEVGLIDHCNCFLFNFCSYLLLFPFLLL